MLPVIDSIRCKGKCRICEYICPDNVFLLRNGHESVEFPDQCTACGYCLEHCPKKAIRLLD